MNDVLSATRLDLAGSRPYLKQLAYLLAVIVALAFVLDDPGAVVPMSVVFAVLMASAPFAIADKNDLGTLYAVLPLRRGSFLLGRYLFAVVTFVAAAGGALVAAMSVALLRGVTMAPDDIATLVAASFAVFGLMVALQYPVYLAMGYLRARMVSTLPFLGLMAAVMLVASNTEGVELPSGGMVVPALVVGTLALLAASLLVASRLKPQTA